MFSLDRHKTFLYQNYLLYAIAFFIPLFPKVVPLFIVCFGALSIWAILKGYSRVEMTQVSILLLLLFGLHLVGMIFTENVDRGWFDVEVKLSLMAFPLAFIGFRFLHQTNFNRTLRAFLFGSLLASIFCLAQSLYAYAILDKTYHYFIASRFSVIIHPSYFALYLIFAMITLVHLEWPVVHQDRWRTLRNVATLIVLSISVLLTASKSGFIMWSVMAIGLTALFIREMEQKWIPILGLTVMVSIMGAIFQNAPLLQARITNVLKVAQSDEVNPQSNESTALRFLIYRSSLDLVEQQPWYGQGTGDFQDALDEIYEKRGYTQAAERHLNAHNLFLQSWIGLGFPGFVLTLGIFLMMLVQSLRNKDVLFLGFTIIFGILSMTESTLNVQAGVVFFAFFAVFLARRSSISKAVDEQQTSTDDA